MKSKTNDAVRLFDIKLDMGTTLQVYGTRSDIFGTMAWTAKQLIQNAGFVAASVKIMNSKGSISKVRFSDAYKALLGVSMLELLSLNHAEFSQKREKVLKVLTIIEQINGSSDNAHRTVNFNF